MIKSLMGRSIRAVFALFFALWCVFPSAVGHSAEIPSEQAIRAILGEARGEGFKGMYAVACAIRNRGTLKGVYGATAETESIAPELWQRASKAWYDSEDGGDPTLGAQFWENVEAFGRPSWSKDMVQTYKVGHHTFFRESKRT